VQGLLAVALDADARGRGFRAKRQAFALRDRALLELLYGVGLRCAEAAAVEQVDLDLDLGTLLLRRVERGQSRVVPLPPAALPHLARYVHEAATCSSTPSTTTRAPSSSASAAGPSAPAA